MRDYLNRKLINLNCDTSSSPYFHGLDHPPERQRKRFDPAQSKAKAEASQNMHFAS
jgi:hypothetical protein